ncbi:MAG: DUF1080 domain-containing protein [Verrucomicrobiae bacterium]|nr:DUF1080 domain-containing protein [Verrucomicrobiae bacterium]
MNRPPSSTLALRLLPALALLAPLPAAAAEHVLGKDGTPGYRDTEVIPGTQWHKHDPDRPVPPVVTPGKAGAAPSDAIILFDGHGLANFEPTEWKVDGGAVVAAKGNLVTTRPFGDMQLHLEWCGPVEAMEKWTNQGNSGVLIMGLYEIQVFDSHSTKIYADGQAAAVYGETPPLANATLPRGEWQTYDIVFKAPVYEGDRVVSPPRVTVFHNGVLAQHDTEIKGRIAHRKIVPLSPHPAKLPLTLSGHSCPVKFRNIWVRELALP